MKDWLITSLGYLLEWLLISAIIFAVFISVQSLHRIAENTSMEGRIPDGFVHTITLDPSEVKRVIAFKCSHDEVPRKAVAVEVFYDSELGLKEARAEAAKQARGEG